MNNISKISDATHVYILGFGREGQSTYRYLRNKFPKLALTIGDQKSESEMGETLTVIKNDPFVSYQLGQKYLDSLESYDVIFKTPGIPLTEDKIQIAVKKGVTITTQVNEFLSLFRDRSIGITGTKGKSTTSSLICHILQSAGRDAVLLGNIGTPVFNMICDDNPNRTYVLELSSHQLSDVTISPHVGVILNLYPEHLDYYKDLQSYANAKKKITDYQSHDDILIYNAVDTMILDLVKNTQANKFGFSVGSSKDRYSIENDIITCVDGKIPLTSNPLSGVHNLHNIIAAFAVCDQVGIKKAEIVSAIATFKPLDYRLQNVGTLKSITFYDDTLATIPEAAVAALQSLGNTVDTLIVGGFDRGLSFNILAKAIVYSHVNTLILLPTTGEKIWQEVEKIIPHDRKINHCFAESMEEVVALAYKHTQSGKICLLSPASPSFGIFKDYQDRSEQFKMWIRKLNSE